MINNVKLINKEYIANETLKFVFARPDGFDFRAGQFGDLTLINPPETDEEGNTRGFSKWQTMVPKTFCWMQRCNSRTKMVL